MELDKKDIQLLEILEKNSKSPVQELSDKTGIPASTVHHRIKKLETNNIIKRYTSQLNEKIMGRGFSAYVMVNGSPEKYLDDDFFNHNYVSGGTFYSGGYVCEFYEDLTFGSGYREPVSIGVTDIAYEHRFVSAASNSVVKNTGGTNSTQYQPTSAEYESHTGRLLLDVGYHTLAVSYTHLTLPTIYSV